MHKVLTTVRNKNSKLNFTKNSQVSWMTKNPKMFYLTSPTG